MEENNLTQEQVNAMVETAKNPQNAVRLQVTNKVSEKLIEDKEIQNRVDNTANKVINTSLNSVEHEADALESESNHSKLSAYFTEHKEELETAGITEPTYMEDMERAVNWHRKCSKIHWIICGWWMTLIKTFILKAKPFKFLLNMIGILLNIALIAGIVYLVIILKKGVI